MLPVTLESRADQIFEEIGGLKASRSYFSEEELTDICLFNGFTEILFPFYKPFENSLNNGLYDYKSIDLTLINYEPGGYVCVTDKYFNPLYNTLISPEIIDGKLSYYFGRSTADNQFLSSCTDGQLLFLMYKTRYSTQLAQIIVSHRLPASVIDLNRNQWESGLKAVGSQTTSYSELVINNPSNITISIFKLEGSLKESLTEEQIVYGENTSLYTITANKGYLKFDRDAWVCLREYTAHEEAGVYDISDQQELKSFLGSAGYTLVITNKQGYVMTKQDGDHTLEVSVTVEEDSTIDSVSSSKFRVLNLTDLAGTNVELIRQVENVMHVSIKNNHIYNSVNEQTQLMSRTAFKVEGNLTYV